MRIPNRCLFALALLASVTGASTLAAPPAAAQVSLRTDAALRATMSTRLKAGGTAHHVAPDLLTMALWSSSGGFLTGAAIPSDDGLRGILDGEPFALLAVEGPQLKIAKGTYRVELASDGEALLLRSNGTPVARGVATIDWIVGPGTGYCEFDDYDDDAACLTCDYGNSNAPGGAWSVTTCFTIWNPFN